MQAIVAFLICLLVNGAIAFVPVSLRTSKAMTAAPAFTSGLQQTNFQPPALQKQRKSVASVQTMGLFGLGAPEIAIILVAAAFLLGPQKLAELGKDAGKIAGELKEVPKEFQKGLAEGEAQAKVSKKELVADESVKESETK